MITRIQYKGNTLSRTKVKNNILKIYSLSDKSDRYDWYAEAHAFCKSLSSDYDIPVSVACGIVSALSPLKSWEQNKKCAIQFIETGDGKHMKAFVKKAEDIINCDGCEDCIKSILKGRKIVSFFENMLHPDKADMVTIDRHALSVALGRWIKEEDYASMTNNQYNFFRDTYKYTANILGISPILLQSSTWERFRKIKQNYR
tara:strand:- start:787 stop:1389 length:603 start_codon:yes stop_codon:yes gene_type:complete